jgi:hypothetical protein
MGIYELTEYDQFITNGVLLNHLKNGRYAYNATIGPNK